MRSSFRAIPRVELLEDRLVPSVTVAESSAGLLTITGDNADGNTVQARDMGKGTVTVTFGNANTGTVTATFEGVTAVRAVMGNGAANSYTYEYLGNDVTTNQEVFTGIGNADSVTISATHGSQTTTGVDIKVHTKSPTQPSLTTPSPFFSGDTVRVDLPNVADNASVNVLLDGKGDHGQNDFFFNLNAQSIGNGASVEVNEVAGRADDRLFAQVAGNADNTSGTTLNGGHFDINLTGGGGAVSEDVVIHIAKAQGFSFNTVTEKGGGGAAFVQYEQNDASDSVFASLDGGGNSHSEAVIDNDAGLGVGASRFGTVFVD
jgi:hypothetical protein